MAHVLQIKKIICNPSVPIISISSNSFFVVKHFLLHSSHFGNNYVYNLFLISMNSKWMNLFDLPAAVHPIAQMSHTWSSWCRAPEDGANSGAWWAGADDNQKHPTPNAPGESGSASSAAFTTPPLPPWEGFPPTPSKGAEEDFQGPGGSECRICRKFVRGGRWAMRSHQIASSRCLAARDGSCKAREPCADCGRSLAANDWWAKQQHQRFCPGSQRQSQRWEHQHEETPAWNAHSDPQNGESWDWRAAENEGPAQEHRSDPYTGRSWDWCTIDNKRPAQEETAGYSHSDPQNSWRAEHPTQAQQDTAEVVNAYSGPQNGVAENVGALSLAEAVHAHSDPQNGVAENVGAQEDTAVAEAVHAHSDPQNGVAENEGRQEGTAVAEAVTAHSDPQNGVVEIEGSAQAEAARPHSDPQNGEPCDSQIAAQENTAESVKWHSDSQNGEWSLEDQNENHHDDHTDSSHRLWRRYYNYEEQDDWNWNQWDWRLTSADNRNSYRQERRYDNTENHDSESTNNWQTRRWSDQDWRTSQSCWLPDRRSNDAQDNWWWQ